MDERRALWLGRTALMCPWIIGALAIPIFVAALWALRTLAPTRQRLAGFSAGCLAGAAAAGLYAIHCNETAAAFVVSWYTAGILLPGLVGVLIGPRVLHWWSPQGLMLFDSSPDVWRLPLGLFTSLNGKSLKVRPGGL